MNLWFRLIWAKFAWRFRSKTSLDGVGSRNFRVWPTDLDIFLHMNNGKFFTLMDTARYDHFKRSGTWQKLVKLGWYPVVVSETITFRKSLQPWQVFAIETKIIGWDDMGYYIEQRFVVGHEVYTKAIVRVRFLKKTRGILTPLEVNEAMGGWVGIVPVVPAWILEWNTHTTLPKGREPAPSDWSI